MHAVEGSLEPPESSLFKHLANWPATENRVGHPLHNSRTHAVSLANKEGSWLRVCARLHFYGQAGMPAC